MCFQTRIHKAIAVQVKQRNLANNATVLHLSAQQTLTTLIILALNMGSVNTISHSVENLKISSFISI